MSQAAKKKATATEKHTSHFSPSLYWHGSAPNLWRLQQSRLQFSAKDTDRRDLRQKQGQRAKRRHFTRNGEEMKDLLDTKENKQ